MKPIYCVLIIALLVSLCSGQQNRLLQYTTTATRTATVVDLCENFDDRTTLVDQSAQSQNQVYQAQLLAHFGTNGNGIVRGLVNNSRSFINTLNQVLVPLITFIGPFLVALVVILIIWAPLLCCCCCTNCCPSKCCQKDDNQQYTKCQLYWPTIFLIVAILLTLVAGIVGLTKATAMQNGFNAVGCSVAITFDDLINGNVSTSGTFFIGINTLYNQLDTMSSNLLLINTSLADVGSSGAVTSDSNTKAGTAKGDVDLIPDNTPGGSVSSFNYGSAFDSSSPSNIASTFPGELGSTNILDTGTQIYDTYAQIEISELKVSSVMSLADSFGSAIPGFQSAVVGVRNTVNTFSTLLKDIDKGIYDFIKTVRTYMTIVTAVTTAVMGVIVGLSVLVILGAILMTFCDKYKCRYLLYFSCFFLFIIGLLGFVISVVLSVVIPPVYFTCQFIQYSLASSTQFNENLGKSLGSESTSYFTVCLSSGSGDIIGRIGGGTVAAINSLQGVINQMTSFNATALVSGLDSRWNTLNNFVTNRYSGHTLDFSSSSDRTILNRLADPSNYAGCTSGTFQADSWVPSSSGGTISCTGSGSSATSTQCSSTAVITAASGGCDGCMDSQSILEVIDGAGSDVATILKARYSGGGDCDTWADEMKNVWDNFYSVKDTQFNSNGINSRLSTADSSVSTYSASVTGVGTQFDTTLAGLNSISSSITDPTYGLIAGLNCRIFGQDASMVVNTFCASFFNVFYFLRLALGIGSFGILFSMCCIVCSGVRHYKHGQRKDKLMPNNGDETLGNLDAKM